MCKYSISEVLFLLEYIKWCLKYGKIDFSIFTLLSHRQSCSAVVGIYALQSLNLHPPTETKQERKQQTQRKRAEVGQIWYSVCDSHSMLEDSGFLESCNTFCMRQFAPHAHSSCSTNTRTVCRSTAYIHRAQSVYIQLLHLYTISIENRADKYKSYI